MSDDTEPAEQETPAATVDLDEDDADTALMTNQTHRHGHLDPFARLYDAAVAVGAVAAQDEAALAQSDVDFRDAAGSCSDLAADLREHVLEEHEHAVRWTLDRYDEMDYHEEGGD